VSAASVTNYRDISNSAITVTVALPFVFAIALAQEERGKRQNGIRSKF